MESTDTSKIKKKQTKENSEILLPSAGLVKKPALNFFILNKTCFIWTFYCGFYSFEGAVHGSEWAVTIVCADGAICEEPTVAQKQGQPSIQLLLAGEQLGSS